MRALNRRLQLMAWGTVCSLAASVACAQAWDPTPKRDVDAGGDKTKTPIIFVHGASGAGEQFERQAMHFTSNGYPATWVVAIDRSTGGGGGARGGGGGDPLDTFVDEVRKRTGHAKVNLVGHSAGTGVCARYLGDATKAAKVAHYAAVGGGSASNPNGVACIAVSGLGDNGRGPSSSNGGKVAWMPDYQDHVMVCTSDESFWSIYTFFNDGQKPKTFKIEPEAEPLVGGYVKSSIINKPLEGAKVEVWEVAKETGKRSKDKPLVTFTAAADGKWGPFRADPKQYYEFCVHEKNVSTPRHIYREPFKHTDMLVYFRLTSSAEGYSPSPFDRQPKYLSDKTSVFSVRQQNGSFLPGVMTLKVDGTDIIDTNVTARAGRGGGGRAGRGARGGAAGGADAAATDTATRGRGSAGRGRGAAAGAAQPGAADAQAAGGAAAPAEGAQATRGPSLAQPTNVVIYLADGNENGKTDLGRIADGAFSQAFISSCDMYIPADPNKTVKFQLNDRVLNVPAWKGTDAAHISVVFDDFH